MTLMITGGCGYIGSHVTRQLSEAGYNCVVYDNLSTGHRESLLHDEPLIEADLADEAALDYAMSTYRPSAILHFAASIIVPESMAEPLLYYGNNVANSIRLLNACQRHQVKHLVFSSTAAVYGLTNQDYVSEESPVAPINPYSSSKAMVEQIVSDVCRANSINYIILRYFNVAGADPLGRMGLRSRNATHLIKVACEAAFGVRSKVPVFGTDYQTPDGTGVRDYIHVEDLAAAHVLTLPYLAAGRSSAIVNCGYGRGYSVLEVLKAVEAVSGRKIATELCERRPGDVARIVAKSDKIRNLLGWTPRFDDLAVMIRDSLNWESKVGHK